MLNKSIFLILNSVSLILAILTGVAGYVRLQDKVQVQASEIQELKQRTNVLKEWQEEWVKTGELKEDVRQNAELKFHTKCIERIRERLTRLEHFGPATRPKR